MCQRWDPGEVPETCRSSLDGSLPGSFTLTNVSDLLFKNLASVAIV